MEDKKIYLLAESTVLPGFLEEAKTILKEALIPTLQEPGCEALYETGRKDDPHELVFFEVFSLCGSTSSSISNRTIQSGCSHRWRARCPERQHLPN